jgi:hypothetical protein
MSSPVSAGELFAPGLPLRPADRRDRGQQVDHDELEDTMRHGLQELANDAPRAEGLWETTANMIAVQADQAPEAEPVADSVRDSAGLPPLAKIGIALGSVIAVAVAIILIALLVLRS